MDWNNLQPVEGHENLYRDKRSGAIINTDQTAFDLARKRLALARERKKSENELYKKVDMLENEMSEIKSLLKTLVEKTNGST